MQNIDSAGTGWRHSGHVPTAGAPPGVEVGLPEGTKGEVGGENGVGGGGWGAIAGGYPGHISMAGIDAWTCASPWESDA